MYESLVQELSRLEHTPCECEPATYDNPGWCCPRCERIDYLESLIEGTEVCRHCGSANLTQYADGEPFCNECATEAAEVAA